MANPSSLDSLEASSHPLGNEIDLLWVVPVSLPTDYRVDLFKKQGADITQAEIDAIMGGTPQEGVTVIQPPNDYHGMHDLEVEDAKTYYYRGIVVNTDTNEYSPSVGANAVPDFTAAPDITDCKSLVFEAVRRMFRNRSELRENKNLWLRKDHNIENAQFPLVTITRAPGAVAQRVIGQFVGTPEKDALGDLEWDTILVTWSDVLGERRDKITLLFRAYKWEIRRYLVENDVEEAEISIGEDTVDPRFENAYVPANSMTVRCLIQSVEEYPPQEERGYPVEMEETPVTS